MEAIDDSAMKYSFKDNYAMGIFIRSWRVGGIQIFQLCTRKVMKKRDKW